MAEHDTAMEAATSPIEEEVMEVFTSEDKGVLVRLWVEASNLLELLADDTEANIRWGDERSQIEEALREAKELLWPNK